MKNYNLKEYYNLPPLQKYVKLTVWDESIINLLITETVVNILTFIPGGIGYGIRNIVYPVFFRNIDRKAFIGSGVILRCPKKIRLMKNTIIEEAVHINAQSNKHTAIEIGEGSRIRSFSILTAGPFEGFIKVGRNSTIGYSTIIYGHGGVTVGDNVMIAAQCYIVAQNHTFKSRDVPIIEQDIEARGIVVGDDVWIGAGVKILDGVIIGKGAVIGAGSVVTKDVPAYTVNAGIPTQVIAVR